jgi:hypothetical protein
MDLVPLIFSSLKKAPCSWLKTDRQLLEMAKEKALELLVVSTARAVTLAYVAREQKAAREAARYAAHLKRIRDFKAKRGWSAV